MRYDKRKLIEGHVVLHLKRRLDISKIGITFNGTTKQVTATPDKARETQLFTLQEILWNAAPSKGKAPARKGYYGLDSTNGSNDRKGLCPTSGAHTFLFAIKWPQVNFPPNLPPQRSLVQTEYVLRAFIQVLKSDEEITSEPLYVEFRPHIDPSRLAKQTPAAEPQTTIVKDDNDRVLGEASLSCSNPKGLIFGSECQLTLNLLLRQSDPKRLPRKAKIEVCEIHKSGSTKDNKQQCFILSHETILLPPEILKPHQECKIPLRIQIPIPEVDSQRGATGLPTLTIDGLEVQYLIRVSIPLNPSRFPTSKMKVISVECPVVVGNVKPKERGGTRKVPKLVVNAEGEGTWDSQAPSSKDQHNGKKRIVEWSEVCKIPRFLAGGDVDEEDI